MADTPDVFSYEPTVQMPRPKAAQLPEQVPQPVKASHSPVAIVQGATGGLSQHTYSLRCDRLQIASFLLFAGYLAFFLRNLFYLDTFNSTADWLLFWDHLAITILTGLIGLRLWTRCEIDAKVSGGDRTVRLRRLGHVLCGAHLRSTSGKCGRRIYRFDPAPVDAADLRLCPVHPEHLATGGGGHRHAWRRPRF